MKKGKSPTSRTGCIEKLSENNLPALPVRYEDISTKRKKNITPQGSNSSRLSY